MLLLLLCLVALWVVLGSLICLLGYLSSIEFTPIVLKKLFYWAVLYIPGTIQRVSFPVNSYTEIHWGGRLQSLSPDSSRLNKLIESHHLPNVVLIIADDLGVNDLSGGAMVKTPFIDSLIANGVSFSKGYAGHATCAPSRAALYTGRYATKMGFEFTPMPSVMSRLFGMMNVAQDHSTKRCVLHTDKLKDIPACPSQALPRQNVSLLSEELQQRGYSTYFIGKWHLGEEINFRPLERGFNESLCFLKGE
jgi:hypothetical protein